MAKYFGSVVKIAIVLAVLVEAVSVIGRGNNPISALLSSSGQGQGQSTDAGTFPGGGSTGGVFPGGGATGGVFPGHGPTTPGTPQPTPAATTPPPANSTGGIELSAKLAKYCVQTGTIWQCTGPDGTKGICEIVDNSISCHVTQPATAPSTTPSVPAASAPPAEYLRYCTEITPTEWRCVTPDGGVVIWTPAGTHLLTNPTPTPVSVTPHPTTALPSPSPIT